MSNLFFLNIEASLNIGTIARPKIFLGFLDGFAPLLNTDKQIVPNLCVNEWWH